MGYWEGFCRINSRQRDSALKRTTRRSAQPFNRGTIVAVETAQGAVDVEVGGVYESHQGLNLNRVDRR